MNAIASDTDNEGENTAMPSVQFHLIRLILNMRRRHFRWNSSVDQFRAMMKRRAPMFRPPKDVRVEPVRVGEVPAEWLIPPDCSDRSVILYLHGGAWTLGWTAIHRRMVAYLAKAARCRVLAVDYRIAPEHPFPAALEDCLASYRWLLSQGTSARDIVIAGDSAGGNLTLTTLMSLRDGGEPLPAAAVCISAATDLEGTGESFWTIKDPVMTPEFVLGMRKLYIGGHDVHSPLISPLHGDLRGLPPLLVHVGGAEMLLSDSESLAAKAREAGVDTTLVVWPKMWHVWHLFVPTMPESRDAVEAVGAFIRKHLDSPSRL